MGRRPHTEVRLRHFINHKSHAIRVPKLSTAPQKRCNSNDTISKFEMFAQELHATFLGNHNTRPHRTPSRGHLNTGDAQAPEVPASPAATTARSTGALHPIWGAAPDRGRCTRTEEVHCLRIGCSAPTHKNKRGTGKPSDFPPTNNPSTGHRTRDDNPVSAGSVPSPRPRWLQYRSASPVRRCGRPPCRRPGPYQ